MYSLFSFGYNFSRDFSFVTNLVPLERYSKAQYFALVFVFKNRNKSEEKWRWKKSAFDTSMLKMKFLACLYQKMKKISFWYKHAKNFIFTSLESWKIGKLKNIYFYGEILLLTFDIRGIVREIDSFFCFRVFSKQTESGGSITLCDAHINIF